MLRSTTTTHTTAMLCALLALPTLAACSSQRATPRADRAGSAAPDPARPAPPATAAPATAAPATAAPTPAPRAPAATPTPTTTETAIVAGGCFWGMEDLLRDIPGVIETDVGYAGGDPDATTYDQVHDGTTGQAEAVRIVFDPKILSFAHLLEKWFFRMHDPTTVDRQGNDIGSQYRSAIFATSPEQRRIAEEVKARVGRSGLWPAPIVTQIVDAGPFAVAEDDHQDYLEKNPDGYTCHFMR